LIKLTAKAIHLGVDSSDRGSLGLEDQTKDPDA
jgi:hypothetical protein